jgi:hypothetical protein
MGTTNTLTRPVLGAYDDASLLSFCMAGDADNSPYFVQLLLIGGAFWICLLMGAESSKDGRYLAGTIWILVGVGAAFIGYKWPLIRRHIRFLKPIPERPISREDWLKLARDFEACPGQIRAQYSRCGLPGRDTWYVLGGAAVQPEKCRSLCNLAGTMLSRSPHVCSELSEPVRSATDPADRWLYFLKDHRHLDNYMAAVETHDDGRKSGVYSGYINNLPEASLAACIDCAAREL